MNINDELNKLNTNQRQELEKWFAEQIFKLNKVNKMNNLTMCLMLQENKLYG